ncbi:hypothetical protein AC481_02215 [miscellaneous Crenarchaeota group archaeon SMTZ-80]|nr:MAG: hypothetical protein AC481_02215 [miscellaneous Crenarchaeota group archaeon SMTZ-80]
MVFISPVFASPSDDTIITITKYATMAFAVGLSAVAAGTALSKTGAASVASVTENPKLFGRTMVYVGMAEGIAIYGLLIAFLIWVD